MKYRYLTFVFFCLLVPHIKAQEVNPLVNSTDIIRYSKDGTEYSFDLNSPIILSIDKSLYDGLGTDLAKEYVARIEVATKVWENAVGINLFDIFDPNDPGRVQIRGLDERTIFDKVGDRVRMELSLALDEMLGFNFSDSTVDRLQYDYLLPVDVVDIVYSHITKEDAGAPSPPAALVHSIPVTESVTTSGKPLSFRLIRKLTINGEIDWHDCCVGGSQLIEREFETKIEQNVSELQGDDTFFFFLYSWHFTYVMVHELGHILGFRHNNISGSVMSSTEKSYNAFMRLRREGGVTRVFFEKFNGDHRSFFKSLQPIDPIWVGDFNLPEVDKRRYFYFKKSIRLISKYPF